MNSKEKKNPYAKSLLLLFGITSASGAYLYYSGQDQEQIQSPLSKNENLNEFQSSIQKEKESLSEPLPESLNSKESNQEEQSRNSNSVHQKEQISQKDFSTETSSEIKELDEVDLKSSNERNLSSVSDSSEKESSNQLLIENTKTKISTGSEAIKLNPIQIKKPEKLKTPSSEYWSDLNHEEENKKPQLKEKLEEKFEKQSSNSSFSENTSSSVPLSEKQMNQNASNKTILKNETSLEQENKSIVEKQGEEKLPTITENGSDPSSHLNDALDSNEPLDSLALPTQNESFQIKDTILKKETPHSPIDNVFWFWAGAGGNYQRYKQSIPSVNGSAEFQNLLGPTVYLSTGVHHGGWGGEFTYKSSPGRMLAPEGTTLRNGEFDWRTYNAELLYRISDSPWRIRAGVQYHQMPFIDYSSENSLLDIKTNNLLLGIAGFDWFVQIIETLRLELQMRYEHPLQSSAESGAQFNVQSDFSFDGSIGTVYKIKNNLSVGLFFYGHYQSYGFSYSGSNSFDGKQSLLFSNTDLRVGYEF